MSDPIRSISQNNYLLSNGGGGHEYSGANGVYVDNENEVIRLDTSASNAIETVIENSGAWGGVQSDWAVTDIDSPAYIQNKPTEKNLIAGANVTITESNDEVTIETTEIASGLQIVAGAGITVTVSGNQLIIGLA